MDRLGPDMENRALSSKRKKTPELWTLEAVHSSTRQFLRFNDVPSKRKLSHETRWITFFWKDHTDGKSMVLTLLLLVVLMFVGVVVFVVVAVFTL